ARVDEAPVRRSTASILAGAPRRVPVSAWPERPAPRHSWVTARPRPPAGGLSLLASLPRRDEEVPHRGAAAPRRRRRARALPPVRAGQGRRNSNLAECRGDRQMSEPLVRTVGLTRHFRVGGL